MKQLILVLLLACSYSAVAQISHGLDVITKRKGKYGYAIDMWLTGERKHLIDPGFDTLYTVAYYGEYQWVLAHKGKEAYVFAIDNDPLRARQMDTLGINHLFLIDADYYSNNLVGATPDGKLYDLHAGGHEFESDKIAVVKQENKLYYFYKSGKVFSKKGYNRIYQEQKMFVCYDDEGISFFDIEGKLLYKEKVDAYQIRRSDKKWVSVFKDGKRGGFTLDGKFSFPLTTTTTPDRILIEDKYDGTLWTYPLNTIIVTETKDKKGLSNTRGDVILKNSYKDVIAWNHERYPMVLARNKKNLWEMSFVADTELDAFGDIQFDEFIGCDSRVAIVRFKKELWSLEMGETELSKEMFTEDEKEIRKIQSTNGKVGIVNKAGELVVPCVYSDIITEYEGILQIETDSGRIALDYAGEIACAEAFEYCFPFEQTTGAYCYKTATGWGIFTLDKSAGFLSRPIFNGFRAFNIDVVAHTSLAPAYVFMDGDKKGLIDAKGQVMHAATYDELIHDQMWDAPNMYLGRIGDKYTVFSSDAKKTKEIDATAFIEFHDKWGYIFVDDKNYICIDPKTLEPLKYYSKYPVHVFNKFGDYRHDQQPKGVIDGNGNIIIPMEYPFINDEQFGAPHSRAIIVGDTIGNRAFYTLNGKAMTDFEFQSIHQPCNKLPEVYHFKHMDGRKYLSVWNAETETFKQISDDNVSKVKCNYKYKEGGFIATITYTDNTQALLYKDYRIEKMK